VDVVSANTKVYDSQSASASGSQTGLFTFEDDLTVSSASVDDSRVNPNDTVTFSGVLYYEGTSTPPEDTSGIVVKLELAGVEKNSTTSINATGGFSFSVVTSSSVANNSYTIYSYTDQNSVTNGTVSVVTDGLNCSSFSVDLVERKVYVKMVYAYDGSAVNGGNVTYAGLDSTTNSTGWASFDTTSKNSIAYNTTAYGVNDGTYGITYLVANQTVQYQKDYVDPLTVEAKVLITESSYSSSENKLRFTASGTGTQTIKVYCGSMGQPYKLNMDGDTYSLHTIWEYDSTTNVASITTSFSSHQFDIYWEVTSEPTPKGGSLSGGGGGAVPSETPSPSPTPTEVPTYVPPPTPAVITTENLFQIGVVGIIAIILMAYVYPHLQKESKTAKLWAKKLDRRVKVKWKKKRKRT